ncbi:NUDIX hydrolase [Tessaracoccus oleiagri]|uniref:8-oxo-dGTP diphosphatase n=1 Tax=Tessaracoccus oleiagri TaxID=686624 RepID=A0A1G9MUV5_9ACTN|nr:NUDIX hydrolase [Tessaracoccus oleiagri]SDL78076.1 8-oxo-dGTP diphosphatase [Tessaracoccus oleiagri]
MSKRIRASGAVVLREKHGRQEVLLVHRQAYDDWTLPKGKGLPDELAPVTAVREVREETGVVVQLGLRLHSIRYTVGGGNLKTVDYWRARPIAQFYHPPDQEVDINRWVPVDEARGMLTYADEVPVLEQALDAPQTTPLLLVRHAKAMLRKNWSGDDQCRRLSGRGRRQAVQLIPLLEAYGVSRLVSSPAVRCTETLAPYCHYRDLDIETLELLTEEEGTRDPDGVVAATREAISGLNEPTAVCGHRPVLPAMQTGMGIKPRPMVVAEALVLHRDRKGRTVELEILKPKA